MINRSAVSVYVRQPFIDWLRGLPDTGEATLEAVNHDPTLFLLPEYGDDAERDALLGECFDLIFDDELSGWSLDEAEWPAKRDLATFKEWFDVRFHSVAIDLVDAPLLDDDDEDFEDEENEGDEEE